MAFALELETAKKYLTQSAYRSIENNSDLLRDKSQHGLA